MMKKVVLTISWILLIVNLLFSQQGNVLVISFGDRMFYNEAAPQMLKASGFTYDEMVKYFETSLASEIYRLGGKRYISPSGAVTTGDYPDVKYAIRGLLSFYMAPIVQDETKKKIDLFGRPSSKLSAKEDKSGEKEGELVSIIGNNKTTYVASKIRDRREFAKIVRGMGARKVLVFNEFDIKEDMSSPYNNGTDHLRQIQLHYTIFDAKGNALTGGVAVENFSSSENNIKEIVDRHFPRLVRQVMIKLQ